MPQPNVPVLWDISLLILKIMTWNCVNQYIVVQAMSVSLTFWYICLFHNNIYASLCYVYVLHKLRNVSLPSEGLSANNWLVPHGYSSLGLLRGLPKLRSVSMKRKKNQQVATIRCLLLNSVSTCFRHHYAHLQENKGPVTAFGVLFWFCWLWFVAVVGHFLVGCEH